MLHDSFTHVHVHTRVRTRTHAYTRARTHTHTHTNTQAHTHPRTLTRANRGNVKRSEGGYGVGKTGKKTEVESTCGIVCSGELLTPAFPVDPLWPLPSVSGSVSIRSNDWPGQHDPRTTWPSHRRFNCSAR